MKLLDALNVLWVAFRHVLAVILTAWVLAAIPAIVALSIGAVGMFIGVVLTVILPLGADPPIFGLAFGVVVTIAMAIVALGIPVVVLCLTHLLAALGVMPLMVTIELAAWHWGVKSWSKVVGAYIVAGTALGACLGGGLHLIAMLVKLQANEHGNFVPILYLFGLVTCLSAVAIYATTLAASDLARSFFIKLGNVFSQLWRRPPMKADLKCA